MPGRARPGKAAMQGTTRRLHTLRIPFVVMQCDVRTTVTMLCSTRKQLLRQCKQKVSAQAKAYAYEIKQLLELDLLLDKLLLVLEAIAYKQLLRFMHTAHCQASRNVL